MWTTAWPGSWRAKSVYFAGRGGFAPLPVLLREPAPVILAVGAHLKNTVALSVGRQVFISQHIGDLETPEALAAFERVIADFLRLYEAQPVAIAHDMHPEYLSTKWAKERKGEKGKRGKAGKVELVSDAGTHGWRNGLARFSFFFPFLSFLSLFPSSPSSTTTRIWRLVWRSMALTGRRWA